MGRICAPKIGLFPEPKDIQFDCSCPDGAYLCKHVGAALYGIGVRFDAQPEMLFMLRGVNSQDLILNAEPKLGKNDGKTKGARKLIDSDALGDVFGLDMAPEVVASKVSNKSTPKRLVGVAAKRSKKRA